MKKDVNKARSLSDIDLEEVSLVDLPANKRKFLFFKSGKPEDQKDGSGSINKEDNLKISIESNGSKKGTKILVNGEEIEGMNSFYFSLYEDSEISDNARISCSYTKAVEVEDGFKRTESYYLTKGDNPMDNEMKALLAELLGEDFDADEFAKSNDTEAIKGALKLVAKYKSDFPDELVEAVKVLAKNANYTNKAEENDSDAGKDNDLEKSGKKFSKDTIEKLLAMFKTLQSILPNDDTSKTAKKDNDADAVAKNDNSNDKDKVEKNADDKSSNAFDELKKSIEKMATENADSLKELSETVDQVSKRLEAVEKEKGVKKGIDGQDDNSDDDEKVAKGAGKDGKVLWPSLVQNDDNDGNDE